MKSVVTIFLFRITYCLNIVAQNPGPSNGEPGFFVSLIKCRLRSREEVFNHVAVDVSEAETATLEGVGEAGVVDP